MCVLNAKYPTALDILRRFDFADFRTGPMLSLDEPEFEQMRGLFQHGFF